MRMIIEVMMNKNQLKLVYKSHVLRDYDLAVAVA